MFAAGLPPRGGRLIWQAGQIGAREFYAVASAAMVGHRGFRVHGGPVTVGRVDEKKTLRRTPNGGMRVLGERL